MSLKTAQDRYREARFETFRIAQPRLREDLGMPDLRIEEINRAALNAVAPWAARNRGGSRVVGLGGGCREFPANVPFSL